MRGQVTPEQLPLGLALVNEALGRFDEAERHFAEARSLQPLDAVVLLRSAAFYIRLDRPADVEPLLRTVLKTRVHLAQEHQFWPRRQLALILAEQGDEGRRQALILLEANGRDSDDPTADLRAEPSFAPPVRRTVRRPSATWKPR